MGELVGVDWDMFHSRHPAALLHATARAISGGPVYVSDRPGNHDFDLLRRLVLADGSVLRCRLPGRPTADCLFANVSRDNATALKVWNVNPVTGVVGVFNVQGSTFSRTHRAFHTHDHNPPTLTATVRPKDVARMAWREGDMAALYSDKQGTFTVVNAVDGESGLTLTVEPNGGCDVVVISRVHSAGPVLFAPIGLTQMLNAGGAVLESELREESNGSGDAVASLKVKGSGPFLAYASHRPEKVMVGGAQVAFEYVAVDAALRFNLPEDSVGGLECIIEF